MGMKRILPLFALVASLALAGAPARALTVVELFTSQGCSSCPPADALLAEMAARDDLLALSCHVDYWDYIGWKDPFARAENTERQRVYARRLGLPYVYTPQIVVQGITQAVGSQRAAVLDAIGAARREPEIGIAVRRDGAGATVVPAPTKTDGPVAVTAVEYDREQATDVQRGENGGRRLRHVHVLRAATRIGTWNGEAAEFRVPPPAEGRMQAVILQAEGAGRILGAIRTR